MNERPNAPELPLLLDVPEAARVMGMSARWTWEQVHAGNLPVVALGRRRKVRRQDLERFVEDRLTAQVEGGEGRE